MPASALSQRGSESAINNCRRCIQRATRDALRRGPCRAHEGKVQLRPRQSETRNYSARRDIIYPVNIVETFCAFPCEPACYSVREVTARSRHVCRITRILHMDYNFIRFSVNSPRDTYYLSQRIISATIAHKHTIVAPRRLSAT